MAKKIAKGLWISADLAAEFDQEVQRLARLMPEKLETGEVGAAALLGFLRLPDDKQKLEAIRTAKNYALDKAIQKLPEEPIGTAADADRVVDDASAPPSGQRAGKETRRRRKAGG
jgi:hypothetical protein